MTGQFVQNEVVVRTGTARHLLTPTTPGDEGYGKPVYFQLAGETVDGVQRARSVQVQQVIIVDPNRPRDDERMEVKFVDPSEPSVFVGYDEEVTVHRVDTVSF